jgi:flagellar protein FlaI
MVHDLQAILQQMERRLLDYVEDLQMAETDEDKAEVLLRAVDENTQIVREPVAPQPNGSEGGKGKKNGGGGLFGFGKKKGGGEGGKIKVTQQQLQAMKYMLVREKLRMGPLEPLLQDRHIEDISCSGVGSLFIEHKIFKALKSNITFQTHEELDEFVLRMAERIQKPDTFRNPIVDATLPDG